MQRKNRIVLWGGWYGSRNVGDQLLLLSITDLIEEYLPGENTFYVLTDDADWVREYASRESRCRIVAIQSRQQIPELISILKGSSLFIFGGGVPFFDQPKQVLVMSFLVFWLRLFRKPYMTWAISSQTIQKWYSSLIYRWVLDGAALITCRDARTQERLQALMSRNEAVHLVADSGFTLEYDLERGKEILREHGWQENERPLVALTPRRLRPPDGESETHYRLERNDDYQRELISFSTAVDWLWEQGYQPVFIPMNTVAPDDDLQAARETIAIAKHGGSALVVDEALRPREVPGLYAACLASYVARVHGSITSFLANTPMMMFAFATKHRGVMRSMGMADYILEGEFDPVEDTVRTLGSLLDKRAEIRLALQERGTELDLQARLAAELMLEILPPH